MWKRNFEKSDFAYLEVMQKHIRIRREHFENKIFELNGILIGLCQSITIIFSLSLTDK